MVTLLRDAIRHLEAREKSAFVTIVSTRGSGPQITGAKMLVVDTKDRPAVYGTIGGGNLEFTATQEALEVLRGGGPAVLADKDLGKDLGMTCGGTVSYLIEPLSSRDSLIICGGGHVGQALYEVTKNMGFSITVVDSLKEFAGPERFPGCGSFINSFEETELEKLLATDESTYIVIASRDHATDFRLVRYFLPKSWKYLGVIASKNKAAALRKELENEGFDKEKMARIAAPIGLPLGGPNPAEIAVSIAAQIISLRYEATRK
jgi:xanthine dehydrogenase accessory factor